MRCQTHAHDFKMSASRDGECNAACHVRSMMKACEHSVVAVMFVGMYTCLYMCAAVSCVGTLHGFVSWFDVDFGAPNDTEPLVLSTSPDFMYAHAHAAPVTRHHSEQHART